MAELKPCPFCGRHVTRCEMTHEFNRTMEITVECDCGARITCSAYWMFDDEDGPDAIEMWNRRADNG